MFGERKEREYNPLYKCRLCGRVFESGGIVCNDLQISMVVSQLTQRETVHPGGGAIGLSRTAAHTCKNGDEGMADFLGFRLRENRERESLLEAAGTMSGSAYAATEIRNTAQTARPTRNGAAGCGKKAQKRRKQHEQ